MSTTKTTTPSEVSKQALDQQAQEAERLLSEARRMLNELAEEKKVSLIRDDGQKD